MRTVRTAYVRASRCKSSVHLCRPQTFAGCRESAGLHPPVFVSGAAICIEKAFITDRVTKDASHFSRCSCGPKASAYDQNEGLPTVRLPLASQVVLHAKFLGAGESPLLFMSL